MVRKSLLVLLCVLSPVTATAGSSGTVAVEPAAVVGICGIAPVQDFDLVPQREILEGQLLAGAKARDAGAQQWFQHGAPCYARLAATATKATRTEFLVGTTVPRDSRHSPIASV